MSGETQPTEPLPDWWDDADADPPRRRRRWPWLVAAVVVLLLVVAAVLLAERMVRDAVEQGVRQQVVSRLDLPPDQEVGVDIPGSLLFQLVTGSVREVQVSSEDVPVGAFSGDVLVELRDLEPWNGPTMADGTATVTLDVAQLRALLSSVEGLPAETVELDAPNITASTELSFFGASFPIGLALTPSAAEGDLLLAPTALQLGGADITADGLRERLGGLVDPLLEGWRVCIAEQLPVGVPLTDVAVEGDRLVADFAVRGALLTDAAQRATGTCD